MTEKEIRNKIIEVDSKSFLITVTLNSDFNCDYNKLIKDRIELKNESKKLRELLLLNIKRKEKLIKLKSYE